MKLIELKPEPFPKDLLAEKLKEHGILTNRYAEQYFAHPAFSTVHAEEMSVVIASLREIGLEDGASLARILQYVPCRGFLPCPANTGLFLRLAWKDQPQSMNSVLSGTHRSPEGAVTVLTGIIEEGDAFPKGLYLRNVDGSLWLRGYVCDSAFRFSGDDLFAFRRNDQ